VGKAGRIIATGCSLPFGEKTLTHVVYERFMADTVNIGPGQRYDVIWKALNPGKWLIHCHIGHHTTNNNVEMNGGGGLMMIIDVKN
jgi:FtsP/CotA-like multicopper oxidase with cupredoxin domain